LQENDSRFKRRASQYKKGLKIESESFSLENNDSKCKRRASHHRRMPVYEKEGLIIQ